MKKLFATVLSLVIVLTSSLAFARDVYVHGYTRKDGTYVQPHYRTSPNSTRNDNYSTRGNINPYTGELGTRPRDNEYGGGNSFGNLGGTRNNSSDIFGRKSYGF